MRTINIKAQLTWQARPVGDCDRWIVECQPLGVAVEANSMEEINGLIHEATDLLFLDLFEDDELHDFLTSKGWSMTETVTSADEDVEFNVPWELVMSNANGSQRRAH